MWHRLDITGGVVKTRDGRALNPGEMLSANDCRLKPHDTTQLHNDVGTVALANQPTNTIVAGPFYLGYENAADQIMVATTDGVLNYFEVAPVTGGAWSTLASSLTSGSDVAVVHRGDEYFVSNGGFKFAITGGTFRALGLADAGSTVPFNLSLSEGSSATTPTLVNDWYAYYVTEYDSTYGLESAATGVGVKKITVATKTIVIDLTSYTQRNAGADKLRIYRHFISNATYSGEEYNDAYLRVNTKERTPIAGLVAEIDITDTSYEDSYVSQIDPAIPYPLISTDDQFGGAIYSFLDQTNAFDVGVIFNDSLVVNDPSTSDQLIRYSPPGYPEYQPTPYFMYFPTEHKDTINGLHVVNDRLVVLGTNATSVVTWLPTVAQLTANQGRVVESLTNGSGCVGKRASAKVDTPQGEFVVWVSQRGLEWSNGVQWDDACPDFTSDSLTGTLANVVLVNNKKQYRLELFDGTTRWDFYYHPSLLKGNRLRLLGPHTAPATIIGGVSFEDKYFLASASTVYQGNYSVSSATTTLQLGHIKGDNPFMDLQCEGIGVTHNGTSSTAKARVYGKLNGEARADSGQKSILDMDKDETSEAALAQRGKYLEPEVEVAGAYAWSIGPLWINLGNPEEGANG